MFEQKGFFAVPFFLALALLLFVGMGSYSLGRQSATRPAESKKPSKLAIPSVPQFSSGKIAFLKKDKNVYIAFPDGRVEQITKDATKKISENLPYPLEYRNPIWSPEGDKFAFEQLLNITEKAYVLISDGKKTATKYPEILKTYWNLPPFWYKNDRITIADKAITTSTLAFLEWLQTNGEDSPYFADFNKPTSCGGGGRPDWSNKLSWNHLGGMDGVRATFLYLKDENEMIYSTGCENETVERVSTDGKITNFDRSKIPSVIGYNAHHTNAPQEMLLSYDRSILVGTLNGNVVLYDTKGKLQKTLTSSGKAYGPVFSHDGKIIFYADNFGGIPSLTKVSADGTKQKVLFKGKIDGAISNISPSPDSGQLIFTLIEQLEKTDVENNNYPEANEDLYIIDADGNNLKLFLNDAYQAAWSPR